METHYGVASSYELTAFFEEVKGFLDDGWTAQGGIAISQTDNRRVLYAQAFIKTTEDILEEEE